MGAVTVITCGDPLIVHDNVSCAISFRKVLALGLYLAVTGQPHSRAQLIALFWPDADELHGQVNLRQVLLRLRQALSPDADAHVRSAGDLVGLDLGAAGSVDVAHLYAATSPQAPLAEQITALERYSGPFLARLTLDDAPDFMEWAAAQRAHWESCYDLIAERAMQQLLSVAQATSAETLGQMWIARRPDCETAYRLLATAQAMSGDVGGARLTLTTATRNWDELGLSLAPETLALWDHLRSLPSAEAVAHAKRLLSLPFVGRDEAFAQLRQALHEAAHGHCGVALVQGEAGIGKSRLVDAFTQWAQVHGSDVAIGHAFELSGRVPYHPFSELLRERLAREHAPDDLLDDSWLIELQRLVPDLHDRYPDLPLPTDDSAAGARLLEAIAQVGIALGRRRPLIWVLEDLHWGDAATRDGLLYVIERWRTEQTPALVVVTLRSEELAVSATLAQWGDAVQRLGGITNVLLSPWSAALTQEAVVTGFSGSASSELCRWLYEQTLGNPLYVMHVMQALEDYGLVQWQDDKPRLDAGIEITSLSEWLPESLRGVMLRRVRRLDAGVRYVLAAAAVVGSRFREDVLASVAGVAEDELVAALETAEQALLIRAEGPEYIFTHDKVAEAIYGVLALARRRLFHRRALRALESAATAKSAVAAELARHALAAGEWEEAVRYHEQAALAAEQIGAHHDAVRSYEQVVRLLTTSPSQQALRDKFSDGDKYRIYNALGLLYATLGEKERARVLYEELLAEARTRGARQLEGWALFMLGKHLRLFDSDPATAERLFEEARQIAQEQGDVSGLLETESLLADVAESRGEFARAWEYAGHVVQLARASGDRLNLAQVLNDLSDVFKRRGEWEAAAAACEESLVLFARLVDEDTAQDQRTTTEEPTPQPFTPALAWPTFLPRIAPLARHDPTKRNSGLRRWGANALMGMGNARLHLGEGDIGRVALQMGWQIFTELNNPRYHVSYVLHKTFGWIEAGHYEQGLRETRQVMEVAATSVDRPLDSANVRPYCALVDTFHALFQPAAAREPLEQASALALGKPVWERLLPATRRCTQFALAGNWTSAAAAAREAQALRDESPSPLTWFDFTRYYETEALLRTGDHVHAEAHVRRLGEHAGTNRRYQLVYLRMCALLNRAAGDHVAAAQQFSEALSLAREMNLPGEEWQIAAEFSASCSTLGDVQCAQEARTESETIIDDLAARFTDLTQRDHFAQAARSRRPALS
jgi:DNA-binding SARP family transcriptional activator/tetratricopeptide (TPR) repeat protein